MVYPSVGVDEKIFHPMDIEEKRRVRLSMGLNPSHITFGMVGRISRQKGWDTFLKAIALLKDQVNFQYVIVGNGPEQKKMEQMIFEMGLDSVILRRGLMPQNELPQIYGMLDFFVFPSQGESLGLVALEAMACGIPVLAGDSAAPSRYVIDGVNGIKFSVGNSDELAARMKEFAELDEQHRNTLKNGALKTAAIYDVKQIRGRFLEVIS